MTTNDHTSVGPPAEAEDSRRRVLVVDDSFIMRKLVGEIVESDPDLRLVGQAENGKVALQLVRRLKPDLVLLDIEMPEMSGLETLRRLGLRSPCHVVILSSLVGAADSVERLEALRLGAAAVIAKPSGAVSLDLKQKRASEIATTIRTVLGLPLLGAASVQQVGAVEPAEAAERLAAKGESAAVTIARFGRLLEGLREGVILFGDQGAILHANTAAATILRRDDLLEGLALATLFDDYNEDLGQRIWQSLSSSTPLGPLDAEFVTPADDWIPLRLTATPQEDSPIRLMLSLEDLSREREMRAVIARTQSSAVARALEHGGSAALAGALRPATILFSDIRDFTSLSEAIGPAGTVQLLNEYFSFMADVLQDQGGTIDKFIGDAIMALFGVPAPLGQDADRAIAAARNMIRALDLLNERGIAGGTSGDNALKIGVGLATGEVLAGTLGSPDRMNYTVIGDAANLASRLEGLTKHYGVSILACGQTMATLATPVACRQIDVLRVKGQARPTDVYEIFVDDLPDSDRPWLATYALGFGAYRRGDFAKAAAAFQSVLAMKAQDHVSHLLLERCTLLQERGRDLSWDGIWTATEK